MKFSPQQVERFREEGWLGVSEFWSDREIAAMRVELQSLRDAGLLHNVSTEGDGTTYSKRTANLQLCPMYPHSRFFRAMPFADKVAEAIGQLIGDPVILHLDQVFLKPAGHGAGTNWHQDNAYFRIPDPLGGTAMWTAVHDATVANGTIRVIPGSYRVEYEHSRDPFSDHHIRCYPPEEDAVSIELPAGGVAFFAYGVAHATGANKTDSDRAGIAHHFVNGSMKDIRWRKKKLSENPWLSGPAASGGEREYCERISGTWEREVERLL
ncbi:MAG: phytanoyl-CoA dioxygenase family protein [Anaerolineaceae bacterium]|nr:phytanoyl-CoA dioxygenase family protein [Anaerolineaceae bacterium]